MNKLIRLLRPKFLGFNGTRKPSMSASHPNLTSIYDKSSSSCSNKNKHHEAAEEEQNDTKPTAPHQLSVENRKLPVFQESAKPTPSVSVNSHVQPAALLRETAMNEDAFLETLTKLLNDVCQANEKQLAVSGTKRNMSRFHALKPARISILNYLQR